MRLTAKLHHPTFNRSEVILLTNKLTDKQTPLKTSTSLRYATPVGNKKCHGMHHAAVVTEIERGLQAGMCSISDAFSLFHLIVLK